MNKSSSLIDLFIIYAIAILYNINIDIIINININIVIDIAVIKISYNYFYKTKLLYYNNSIVSRLLQAFFFIVTLCLI